jgi:hypothetical protein
MVRVLLDETILTDFGQFELVWGDDYEGFNGGFARVFAGQVNGLVGAAFEEGMYVNLARRSGGSPVRIELHEDASTLDPEQWEDVVEVSISVPPGEQPNWITWAGETGDPLELPAGTYRVRVSARGRDAGRDQEFAAGAVDSYLLELWPAQSQPDAIVRTTSADAAYWHREVGTRR